MIKSFPLYCSSIPDFDSPFLCLDLPASNYELEMKRFILFLFPPPLLLSCSASTALLDIFLFFCSSPVSPSTPADTWETTAVLCKKVPLFHCYYMPSHLYFSSSSSWLRPIPCGDIFWLLDEWLFCINRIFTKVKYQHGPIKKHAIQQTHK